MSLRYVSLFMLFLFAGPATADEIADFPAEHVAAFESEVIEILESNCLKCHSGAEPKGGLDLTSREAILKGGESGSTVDLAKPSESLMLQAINYDGSEMPPTGQMSPKQIASLTNWVKNGLAWSKDHKALHFEAPREPPRVNEETKQFWSFKPVVKPQVPDVAGDWPRNDIDRFILKQLQDHGLTPNPQAGPRELVRRACYDLTGLPPDPEVVEAFAADPSPAAWAALIDQLLDSPHYGEQWGRHWLDLVRYAETNSYERDGAKPFVWRYRDYVIQSFNSDKPYDQFITEQLAGDEMPNSTPDSIIATGYYRLGRWDDEPADPELAYYDDLDDIVTTTGQTMLGMSINCARCHDHKIDPIPQTDYYSMVAIFRGVKRYGQRSHESVLESSVMEIQQPEHSALHEAAVAQYERELENVGRDLSKIEDKVKPDFAGVEIDDFQDEVNRVRLIEKRNGGLLTDNEVNRYRSLTQRRDKLRENRPSGMAQALCVKEDVAGMKPTYLLLRGNPSSPGDEVFPGFPSVLSPPKPEILPLAVGAVSSGRRLALARWMASPGNPLTSRVIVNRLWQYHFGRGIVRTSSDFGFQGSKPTHPELLDWLAATFIEQGWSIKSMHRLIMNSATYQMSSSGRDDALAKDATNDHFWRCDMRRLSAEEIRDSILWANGTLNEDRMYGPSIYTDIPAEVKAGQSQPGSGWGTSSPEDQARRSVYIHVKRSLLDPMLESFDMADTDQTCPVRFSTTQPTQALGLLNSDFILKEASIFKDMLNEAHPDNLEAQIRMALQRVTQRPPTEEEIARGLNLISTLQSANSMSLEQAKKYFCLLALNLNEFIYLD
ncbi:MAG TPA: PSD1 and planctomycete cytochrome C domain-containing protein [Planctomycetaceae bacterium]|nr:PSD1 and planctomycete cytochrome C domain-containing protein [Planctomycetaceae bacterium]